MACTSACNIYLKPYDALRLMQCRVEFQVLAAPRDMCVASWGEADTVNAVLYS
ncbi:hypothetical protein MCEZE10_00181 [Sphingomonadaceae bacterium]